MISGAMIFFYLLAGAWLAYHETRSDGWLVRFVAWCMKDRKLKPVKQIGTPVWKGGKLTYEFSPKELEQLTSAHSPSRRA